MYTSDHDRMVEEKCYQVKKKKKVLRKIAETFDKNFEAYLESRKTHIPEELVDKLRDRFLVDDNGKRLVFDRKTAMLELCHNAVAEFKKDLKGYRDLFDQDLLEEYSDDPQQFKTIALSTETPIIRKTLQNTVAKELDKYRAAFKRAKPADLLNVVKRLAIFAKHYVSDVYDPSRFEEIVFYKDFGLTDLDTEPYTVYGVIGGGIKSTMLFKNYPEVFPCRSRLALWALWFLVEKETFGCEMDSEFLMIDNKKNSTQQNYFYPYELFVFYALQIYLLIKRKAEELGISLDTSYRFIYVDAFLNFVAEKHYETIRELSSREGEQVSYA